LIVRKLINLIGFEVDERQLNESERRVNGFKNNLKRVALGVGAAVAAIGWKAIEAAADMEMLTTQFEVMLGSAEKAEALMDQLNEFAATTPFALEDLSKGTQNLLSFGVAEENVIDVMRMLGDTAGGNVEKLNTLVLAYGKVQTKGKASLEELNMMAERGLPIFDILSQQLGVTREEFFKMVSAGKVTADDVTQAFRTLTSEGGMFFQGMEMQSQTFNGIMSTLKDNIKLLLAAIGGELLPVAGKLIRMLTTLVQGSLGDLISALVSGLGPVLETVSQLLEEVFKAVAPLADIFGVLISIITQALGVTGALFPILKPVLAILKMVAGVLTILQPVLEQLIGIVVEFGVMFGEAFGDALMEMIEAMAPAILDLAEILSMVLEMLMPIIKVVLQFYMLWIRIKLFFKTTLFKIVAAVLRGIMAGLMPIIELISQRLSPLIEFVTALFEKWGLTGGQWLDKLIIFIDKIANGIAVVIQWVIDVIVWFTKMKNFVLEIFLSIGGAIRALFEEGVMGAVNYVLDTIKEKFTGLLEWLNKIPGIDFSVPESTEAAASEAEMQRQIEQNQQNTNINMQADVGINMPPGSSGDLSDPAAAGSVMQAAARAAFTIELRKVLVETGL
jgi:tape measure domain-containing protein